ncbi:MAG: GAF domain-containing protein [bacterium]|nr:GAF domain-containing protein [bacterium]
MSARFSSISSLAPTLGDLQKLRTRFIQAFSAMLTVASLLLSVVLFALPALDTAQPIGLNTRVYTLAIGAVSTVLLVLSLRGYSLFAAIGLIAALTGIALAAPPDTPALGLLALIAAAALCSRPVFIALALVIAGKMALEIAQLIAATETLSFELVRFILTRLLLLVIPLIIRYVFEVTERSLAEAQRTSIVLRTSAEIGAASTQLTDLKTLFDRVIDLVQERFNFYHVQVFVINETGDQAVLQASTGEIGRRLLARSHQLAVGSQSVIGQVTLRGEPVVALDTDRDEVHFRNELLLNTRSELAVPIRDGAVVVGALDVQSIEPNAFDRTDVEALQVIADFLGTALRNAAVYDEQARVVQQNQALLREAEENIRLIQRLNRELTRASWESFSQSDASPLGIQAKGGQVVANPHWTDAQKTAGEERRTVTQQDGEKSLVAVPLMLRGEVIGALEVENTGQADTTTVAMLEDVAQRLAISLENARLYEDSRDATAQEQFINTLAARYQSVTSVDELLRMTLVELSETLGATRGSIRLGKLELANDAPVRNGAAET